MVSSWRAPVLYAHDTMPIRSMIPGRVLGPGPYIAHTGMVGSLSMLRYMYLYIQYTEHNLLFLALLQALLSRPRVFLALSAARHARDPDTLRQHTFGSRPSSVVRALGVNNRPRDWSAPRRAAQDGGNPHHFL